MQKIIFDNDVPDYLVPEFPAAGYAVILSRQLQPPALTDGALMQREVDEGCTALVTAARSMEHQHPQRQYDRAQRAGGRIVAPLPVFVLRSLRQQRDEYTAQVRDYVLPALDRAVLDNTFVTATSSCRHPWPLALPSPSARGVAIPSSQVYTSARLKVAEVKNASASR